MSLYGPKISGPHNNWSLSRPRWSLSGPEISELENDQIVWSLSGPGHCLVLLHRGEKETIKGGLVSLEQETQPETQPYPRGVRDTSMSWSNLGLQPSVLRVARETSC